MSLAETLSDHDVPTPSEAERANHATPIHQLVTRIERRPGWQLINVHEIWRYRELLYYLTWRDIKVRYKQTILGAAWAILQPVATMIVFTTFLGPLVGHEALVVPYPIFVFVGLIAWSFFASAIISASSSIVANQNLITKVYFPRLLIPMGAIGPPVVDFAIAFMLFLLLMLAYSLSWTINLLLVPLILLVLFVAALGVGTLLCALTVAYRDFRHAVPFLVQLWMFATPAIYLPESSIGPRAQAILPLNPAYGLIANIRRAAFGQPLDGYSLGLSISMAILFLVIGSFYFRRVERSFADII